MALAYLTDPNLQFVTRNGTPNAHGFIRVFYNGTDDPAVTYKNWDGGLNQEDIELDNDGRAVIIAQSAIAYRIEVRSRAGDLLWDVKNVFTQFFGVDIEGTYPVETEDTGVVPGRKFNVKIAPNGIGRDLLYNHHNLIPDSRYLQFKDFGGNVVVSLCDSLQAWLATEGYTP